MGFRKCNHCEKTKSIEEYNWRWKQKGIRQRTCRACQRKQQRKWYQRNKERHKANMIENRLNNMAKGREFIWNYLSSHPCVDCGESDPRVLEFDHVRGEKRATVTRLVRNGFSIKIIKKEIAKCVIRCANCHKKKTYRNSWRDR